MFESLMNKSKTYFDKKNRNPIGRYFQDPGYLQDTEARKTQVLFYKLLMIMAYSDESVDENEINLIKDYAYECCLTEQEWREINLIKHTKPSKEEIHDLVKQLTKEVKSKSDKKEFLSAIREIAEADDIIKDGEKEILAIVESEINSSKISFFGNVLNNIKDKLVEEKSNITSREDIEKYIKNPVELILRNRASFKDYGDIETIAAVLGLAIVMVHADMEFHEKEREALIAFVEKECSVSKDEAIEITDEIIEIPDTNFEIAYLGRIITDSTDDERRREIMSELFTITRADQVYDVYEDKYLKIIGKYLFIDHKTFIELKLAGK